MDRRLFLATIFAPVMARATGSLDSADKAATVIVDNGTPIELDHGLMEWERNGWLSISGETRDGEPYSICGWSTDLQSASRRIELRIPKHDLTMTWGISAYRQPERKYGDCDYGEFMRCQLRAVSASLNVPVDRVEADIRAVSY